MILGLVRDTSLRETEAHARNSWRPYLPAGRFRSGSAGSFQEICHVVVKRLHQKRIKSSTSLPWRYSKDNYTSS